MAIRFSQIAQLPGGGSADQVLAFSGFAHGLNTYVPADRIASTEVSELVNWSIRRGGSVVTRAPLCKYSTVATTSSSSVKTIAEVNIGGTRRTLLVDDNDRLYYLDGDLEPVLIGTLEGAAEIMTFNGVALVMDGSYLKYLDGVTTVKIAYDAGSGTSAFQFDHSALTNDAFLAVGNGTNLGVAQKFTTQAWTAGYTIPPVTVTAYLSENGSAPAGAITCKIRSFAAPAGAAPSSER